MCPVKKLRKTLQTASETIRLDSGASLYDHSADKGIALEKGERLELVHARYTRTAMDSPHQEKKDNAMIKLENFRKSALHGNKEWENDKARR
jgi:hypothetical protein